MFGLFKKKEKEAPKPVNAEAEEYRAFAAGFEAEDRTVLVLTGPQPLAVGKLPGDTLFTAGMPLAAWLEEDSPDLCREPTSLVTKGDDALMSVLRQRIPRDFILKCKVRPSADGRRLFLTGLPEPGFDPELKAILEESKKPVTEEVEGLGTFTLNRTVGVLQGEVVWANRAAELCFDRDEDRAGCLKTAHALLADSADWDAKARSLAADALLDQANEWAEDAEEDPVSREDFVARIALETIDVSENGSFHLWYNDGDLFFGRLIQVSGTVANGLTAAEMEG